ncbi:recombinase family protein [Microbispora bryophytorum]|uniref:Recombinase domain-containing protein n=1 Tax=Microbispora bryophytorum TaxID=1460882 RepID=A0A8H9GYB4_9ACTN|nr:recombinase family protein [Microbispora bryophytorum]GGN98144.1 hypothetical protein GCM10011574_02420 [Microbispora bryophytorum]
MSRRSWNLVGGPEAGKVAGGGMRPYGNAEDRITVIAEEADVIREAARRVLAGESLASVCKDFQRRDVKTPSGRHWVPTTLRRLLASARISGRREHTSSKTPSRRCPDALLEG